jgi:CBS domain-containing protein
MAERTIRTIIEGQDLLTAAASVPVSIAAQLMQRRRVGAILVVEGERLVGIFTERDALFRVVAASVDPASTPIGQVMTASPRSLHPDRPFADALRLMHEGHFRHVPIVEDGKPVGMVSARDAMGPELETFMYSVIVDEQARDVLA